MLNNDKTYMMKKCVQIMGTVFLLSFSLSCSKEEITSTPTTVGHSSIVYFPTIEVKGQQLVIIKQGDTYTDAGATAILNGQPSTYTTTGTVNTNTPGFYILNYETRNPEGFSATTYRTVAVVGNDIPASRDYSGLYARYVGGTANGQTSTWTKTATGVYTVVNPGGATGVTATAVNYTGNKVDIPQQQTEAGTFASTGGVYNPTAAPPSYQWAIVNAGYGTAVRVFIKQ